MASDCFETFQLESRCLIKSSKRIFAKEYVEDGIPFLRSKDVIDKSLGIFSNYDLFISRERYKELKKSYGSPVKGDLLISSVGNRSGLPYVVQDEGDFYFKDGNIIWISDFKNLDSNFLAYWFKSDIGQSRLASVMIGSAQKALTINSIRTLTVSFPNFKAQQEIAHILGSIDSKIELNRQMNETLENMAQALFKSWFVDFDPVIDNALEVGNSIPDELSDRAEQRKTIKQNESKDKQAINSIFPDEFEWEVTSLGKHVHLQTGPAFKSADFSDIGIKLARGDNVKEGSFQWGDKTRYWSEVDKTLTKYLLNTGDMLIGMDGSKAGKNRTRVRESDLPCLLVQRVARLTKKNTICSNFIFLLISSQYFRDYVDIVKTGSAIPHISGGQIKELKLILPKNEKDPVFNKFEELASSLINRTDACVDNSLQLSKLRDVLLPKLLSGEIRIPEAAALVENT